MWKMGKKLKKLTDREEYVLKLHYGMIGADPYISEFRTPEYLARIFELPFSKIVELENKAIKKLGKAVWMEVGRIRMEPIPKQKKYQKIKILLENFL